MADRIDRVVDTLKAAQNRGGGFGGGHGQFSHVAPSYAAICSLATVGGNEAYELIDRRALYVFLATDQSLFTLLTGLVGSGLVI